MKVNVRAAEGVLGISVALNTFCSGFAATAKLYISFGQRGHMAAANACPQALLLSLDTDKLRETPALQKENIPSFHDITQPGMEEAQLVTAVVPSAPD